MRSLSRILPAMIAAVACALCGCGPSGDRATAGRESPAYRDSHPEPNAGEMISETGVVAMVQNSPTADGTGTTLQWVDRQLDTLPGAIMFPSWVAERRGASKFEVQFRYTLIDNANRIVKRGYAWTVDAPLNLVGPPREMAPEYTLPPDHSGSPAVEHRRVTEEQSSLE